MRTFAAIVGTLGTACVVGAVFTAFAGGPTIAWLAGSTAAYAADTVLLLAAPRQGI
jgi:hypothetical protein